MKKLTLIFLVLAGALTLAAQGPGGGPRPMGMRGPGGPGPEGFGGGFGGGFGMMMGRGVVTGAPYSGTQVSQQTVTLADGNTITHKTEVNIWRDSQGRVRTETVMQPPPGSSEKPFTAISILDPVAGYRYELNSTTQTASQMALPKFVTAGGNGATPNAATPKATRALREPRNGAQIANTSMGMQNINGLQATGTQFTETIPAGAIGNAQAIQVVRTTWISSDLKVPVQIKSSDPRFGTTQMDLINVSRAEPAASLFTVPAGYTIKQGRGFGGPRPGAPNGGPAAPDARRGGPPREDFQE